MVEAKDNLARCDLRMVSAVSLNAMNGSESISIPIPAQVANMVSLTPAILKEKTFSMSPPLPPNSLLLNIKKLPMNFA